MGCGASTPAPARLSPNPALAARRLSATDAAVTEKRRGSLSEELHWLALDDLKSHGALPRRGWDPNFAHPRTSEKNANLSRPLRFHPDGDAAVRLLVSVRALSDDHLEPLQTSTKPVYNLVVAAAERFRAAFCADPSAPLLLWLDFSCLDQDANPIRERGRLKELLSLSDALLTVVVDPTPPPDELLSSFGGVWKGALTEYRAAHWRAYVGDAWRRIECLLAATTPVADADARASLLKAGACRGALEAGRRAHLLCFGAGAAAAAGAAPAPAAAPATAAAPAPADAPRRARAAPAAAARAAVKFADKFEVKSQTEHLLLLPPMLEALRADENDAAAPETGTLPPCRSEREAEELRALVGKLASEARAGLPKAGYVGALAEGKPHGAGKYRLPSGAVFEGEFEAGEKAGHGTYRWPDGSVYVGMYADDKPNGEGRKHFASTAATYEGTFANGNAHGHGTKTFWDGGLYVGEWKGGKVDGAGRYVYADGDVYEGEYVRGRRHGTGCYTFGDGVVAFDGQWLDNQPAAPKTGAADGAAAGAPVPRARRPSVDSLFARRGSVDGGGGGRGARRPSLDDGQPREARAPLVLAELFGWDSNKEAPKN